MNVPLSYTSVLKKANFPEGERTQNRMSLAKSDVTIPNASGLHLRPAATFVQVANRYKGCEIFVTREGQRVNGKSIMGLVMLAAPQDAVLTIECSGDSADEALTELAALVESGFGMES